MSDAARHQQFDIAVLAVSGAPVFIFVLLYFIYSIVVWRARPGDDTDGEIRQHQGPGDLDHRHHGHRAVAVRVRHRRARGAGRRGRGRGPVTHLEAGRHEVVDLDPEHQHDVSRSR